MDVGVVRGMVGVVMAGGQSSRMGRDKGQEFFEGSPMAARTYTLLQSLDLRVVVSVNEAQEAAYGRLFPGDSLVADAVLEMGGPLRGILSVHERFPAADLLVVACDMPLLGRSVLERLVEARRAAAEAPFFAFDSDGIQPLCALYTATALAVLLADVKRGHLPPSCPRRLLASTEGTKLLAVHNEQERVQFTNVNRPAELQEARAAAGALPRPAP